jgi:hypothetical protein
VDLPDEGFDTHKLRKEGIRASETGLIHIGDAFAQVRFTILFLT